MAMYKGQKTEPHKALLNIIGALVIVIITMSVMFFSAMYGLTKTLDQTTETGGEQYGNQTIFK